MQFSLHSQAGHSLGVRGPFHCGEQETLSNVKEIIQLRSGDNGCFGVSWSKKNNILIDQEINPLPKLPKGDDGFEFKSHFIDIIL